MASKIIKGDEVIIIAGKDKGKVGKVIKILSERLIVSGVNLIKKHQKPNPMLGSAGGIIEKEAPLHVSNIAILNTDTNKADRVGFDVQDNKKVRIYKSNNKVIPNNARA